MGAIEDRVGNLEQAVVSLRTALNAERTDRHVSEAKLKQELQKELEQLADLLSDNEAATMYAIEYVGALDNQYFAKELMLQDAIHDFNEFLHLPAKSSQMLAYWDAAWVTIAFVVPALRLTSFFTKMESAAKVEMEASRIFTASPRLLTRMTTYAARGHNIADVITKGNNIRDKTSKATAIHTSIPVDSTKTPVRELILESLEAHKSMNKALDTLDSEFAARVHALLYGVPYTSKGTLVDMARRLLPPLPVLNIEQTGRKYLWTILSKWAPDHVAIVVTRYRSGPITTIDGLNNTQQDQIMEWFGLHSNWQGSILVPFSTIWSILAQWNVPSAEKSTYGVIFGFG